MKRYLLAAASAALLAGSAGAASAQDWSGFYIGGSAGVGSVGQEDGEAFAFDTNLDGSFNDRVLTTAAADAFSPGFCEGAAIGNSAAGGCTGDDDSTEEYSVRAGFDTQMGMWVLGVVGEYSKLEVTDSVSGFSTTPAAYVFTREIDNLMAVRARLGIPVGTFLPYITGGWARADVSNSFTTTNTANAFTPTSSEEEADGFQVGLGVDKQFGRNFTIGAEYLFTDLEGDDFTVRAGPGTAPLTNPFRVANANGTDIRRSSNSIDLHSFRVTAAFRF